MTGPVFVVALEPEKNSGANVEKSIGPTITLKSAVKPTTLQRLRDLLESSPDARVSLFVGRPVASLLRASLFDRRLLHRKIYTGNRHLRHAVVGVPSRARPKDSEFPVEVILSYLKTEESLQ